MVIFHIGFYMNTGWCTVRVGMVKVSANHLTAEIVPVGGYISSFLCLTIDLNDLVLVVIKIDSGKPVTGCQVIGICNYFYLSTGYETFSYQMRRRRHGFRMCIVAGIQQSI